MTDDIATTYSLSARQMESIIFSRELAEIYLLLDYLSGQPGKSLASMVSKYEKDIPDKKDWLERICEITWPPENVSSPGSAPTPRVLADSAAFLLNARDVLNSWAAPATGFTIAFTLLTAGDVKTERAARARKGSNPGPEPGSDRAEWEQGTPSRLALAQQAFPGLTTQAISFRNRFWWTAVLLAVWLLITCCLSWAVALWQADLGRLNQDRATKLELIRRIAADETASNSQDDKSSKQRILCSDRTTLDTNRAVYSSNVEQLCDELYRINKQILRESTISLFPYEGDTEVIGVIAITILPIFYGVLGAGAAMLRTYWAKIRDYTLSPVEYALSIGQLALGAVIGACIGIFVTPTSGSSGIVSSITLSASALSFIAGFGAEAVFLALESFIKRVFNIGNSAHSTS